MDFWGPCSELAQELGALAYTEIGCMPVSGKVIPIGRDEADIQEAIRITNWNFQAGGSKPSVPKPQHLPGPVSGFQAGV